jgi:hypothetical protein
MAQLLLLALLALGPAHTLASKNPFPRPTTRHLENQGDDAGDTFSTHSNDRDWNLKHHPHPIPYQLSTFNQLEFHGMSWFFAKTLSYGASLNLNAFHGPHGDFGPFTLNFVCDATAGATIQISVTNSNSYPITVHGFAVSGDSVAAVTLAAGATSTYTVFSSATVGTLASNSRGSLLTSNGYYAGIDTDGFLLSAGADGMPNSDCSVAGFIYYAHPHHHGYYTGLLASNVDLSSADTSSSSASTPLFVTGVILGVVLGNVALVATVFVLVRNRSLLYHALGLNTMQSSTFSCIPGDDSSHPTSTANPMASSTTDTPATAI